MLTATQSKALDTVMTSYVIPDPDDVRAFLEERPRVAEVLVEALDVVPRYFGPNPRVVLALRDDPEGVEPCYIAGYIRTNLSGPERLERIGQLKDEWWLDASAGLRDEVLLSLNPVRE